MKRFISGFMAVMILFLFILSSGGCSSENNETLLVGKWLQMVDEAFGMQNYTSEEPYFANISADNEYFAAVQIAAEWDVIDKSKALDVEKALTWEEALVSLVNVGSFTSLDTTDEEKVEYAIEHFDSSIRKYWMNRNISPSQATLLLATAQEQWAGLKYTEPVEKVEFADSVLDYSQGENKLDNYKYDNESKKVAIPLSENPQIGEGDVFVLPSNRETVGNAEGGIYDDSSNGFSGGATEDTDGVLMGTTAFKAVAVEKDDKNLYVDVDDNVELGDVAENMYVAETLIPTADNTVIRDGNGNILSVGSEIPAEVRAGIDTPQITNLAYSDDVPQVTPLKSASASHTFKVGDYEVALEYDLDGKFNLGATVKTPNLLGEKSQQKLKGSVGLSVSDLQVTNKIDFEWFKLKEASLRIDYTSKASLAMSYSDSVVDKTFAPKYSNGNGKFLTNLKRSVLKDTKAKGNGAKTIKICSVDIYSIGIARVCLDVNLKVSVDGSVSISITEHGSKGLEYKDNKLRTIKESKKDVDADVKAKIEGTIAIGPALYTIGLKKCILGANVEIGAGAITKTKIHLADSENHLLEELDFSDIAPEKSSALETLDISADPNAIKQVAESQGGTYTKVASGDVKLHIDSCVDVSVYFILRLGLSDNSFAADLLGGRVKVSWEIFGEDNAKLLNIHCENGNWEKAFSNIAFGSNASKSQCTMKYVPFDKASGEDETKPEIETTPNDTILKGDSIRLGEIKTSVGIGEKYYITLQQIPKEYSIGDIVYSSNDSSIVEIDKNGIAVAKKEGSAVITVATNDGKYKAYCAISVLTEKMDDITHIGFAEALNCFGEAIRV